MIASILIGAIAQAYAADRLGSPRPRASGQLTLNPLRHLDPFGSVVLPLILLALGSPIAFAYGRHGGLYYQDFVRRLDFAFAALAPLVAKLVLLIAGIAGLRFAGADTLGEVFLLTFVWINFLFALIWMLPWPPFSLGRFIAGLLPKQWGLRLLQLEPYGGFLFIGLIILGLLTPISPFWIWIQAFFPSLFSMMDGLAGDGSAAKLVLFLNSLGES